MSTKTTKTKNEPIRTAIVGLGRAGWGIHVENIKNRSDYKIVAGVDPDAERRKEAEQTLGCRSFATLNDFLKDPGDTELVIIATVNHQHTPMSIAALQAGFHVVTEKPMAINLKEARKMMQAAKKTKKLFTIHQSCRCHADLHQAMSIIHSGILGKVFFIKMNWTNFARRNDWQTLRKYGGGSLNNTCPHSIDTALQLLESPVVDVWGDLQAIVTAGDAEDHVKILMRGKNGRVLDHEISSASAAPQSKLIIMGNLGTLWRDGDNYVIKYLNPKTLPKLKAEDKLAVPGRQYGVVGEALQWLEKRVPASPPEMRVDFYERLYKSIREGKELFIKPAEVYAQMEVIALSRKGTKFM
ncbi:MAG: Gfo/Idh/MocA family oxidoreductase [Planctomycetota bacterium]